MLGPVRINSVISVPGDLFRKIVSVWSLEFYSESCTYRFRLVRSVAGQLIYTRSEVQDL